jgi:diadenosine tetraphosphate (Ap4A) HIT family hydrolase/5-methylcytosine-specific restriction endonuclease McrA
MQMSHVYQPVMLLTLLHHGGAASKRDISQAILSQDQSQLEYYDQIVTGMVGRVLRSHDVVVRKEGVFRIEGFDQFAPNEVKHLIQLCDEKLAEYIAKRGERIWQHRNRSLNVLSGTVRYEVLKAAKFRCALCGISADEKALEVDHIHPRKHGGTDDFENLQALCYSCNAMKQDRDATDFRKVSEMYSVRQPGCPFCEPQPERILGRNALALCVADAFPVTDGHSLIFPLRHVPNYFDLTPAERNLVDALFIERRKQIISKDQSVQGFNVGVNAGETAGQTVMHAHVHLIPRRAGDVANPRGGIRCVIPNKSDYS